METLKRFDERFIAFMRRRGVLALRLALGAVFLWFGLLKLAGLSPVEELVAGAYSFMPTGSFMLALGVWETLVGVCLIGGVGLRFALALLWLQLIGTFGSLFLAPDIFFSDGNTLLLTMEGEFVVKNIVLAAAGIVIGGFAVRPLNAAETSGSASAGT